MHHTLSFSFPTPIFFFLLIQAASVLQESPEVAVAAVLVERLEDNEALQVAGTLTPAPHGQVSDSTSNAFHYKYIRRK